MKTEIIAAPRTNKDSFAVIHQLVKSHKAAKRVRMVKPYRNRRCFKAVLADDSCIYVTDFFKNGTLRVVASKDKAGVPVVSTCNDLYITQVADLLNQTAVACAERRRVKRWRTNANGKCKRSKRRQHS